MHRPGGLTKRSLYTLKELSKSINELKNYECFYIMHVPSHRWDRAEKQQ